MNRKLWTIFLIVQTVGEVCSWVGSHIASSPGPPLFVIGFILLLPGRVLSVLIVEKLLWNALSVSQMTMAEVPLELAIDLIVWVLCTWLVRLMVKRRSSRVPPSVHPNPSRP